MTNTCPKPKAYNLTVLVD